MLSSLFQTQKIQLKVHCISSPRPKLIALFVGKLDKVLDVGNRPTEYPDTIISVGKCQITFLVHFNVKAIQFKEDRFAEVSSGG